MSFLDNCNRERLESKEQVTSFSCGHSDLDDFIHNDALAYSIKLLAVTYIIRYHDGSVIAFFSVLNDSLSDMGYGNSSKKRINRLIGRQKQHEEYPAVKIGRLGVSESHSRQGLGSELMDFIKAWFTVNNKTGCRFITIDAYNKKEVISFYEKNGFKFLTTKDKIETTRLMYYDLKRYGE